MDDLTRGLKNADWMSTSSPPPTASPRSRDGKPPYR